MPRLVVEYGAGRTELRLGSRATLGRNASCALALQDTQVSGNHCEIALDEQNRYTIRDLKSRNGTFVNGVRLDAPASLRHGDEIRIGQTIATFLEDAPTAAQIVQVSEETRESLIHTRVKATDDARFLPADEIDSDLTVRADYEKLRLANELHREIGSDMDVETVLGRILDRSFELLKYDHGMILLADSQGTLTPRAYKGRSDKGRIAISSTLVRIVKEEKAGLLSVNAQDDARLRDAASLITQGVRSTIAVPIVSRGDVLGVMIVDSSSLTHAFTEKDLQLMTAIAGHTAQYIKNSLLHDEMRASFESSIGTLAAMVDARHPLTAGHSQRVTDYSLMIGEQMGLGRGDLETLKYSALLHDIGKIGIRDNVLLKDGPFTPEERAEMNTHPVKTRTILDKFRFPAHLREVPRIAGYHHERLSGGGYPDGLTGERVPLLSRIIAAADVFDALTSSRDYPKYDAGAIMDKAPMPLARAVALVKEDAECHFGAQVVEGFLRCLPVLLRKHRGAHFPPEYVDGLLSELAAEPGA